ncbi:Uncharacterized protein APZ42_001704 [Daphnia magna]|uniref:Uncharacterized protein n=1 Tax=Daphnia magna TaxID=35525 RepID=A0A164IT73_9CRUS|nr:Uncharacterized protein APZ42_001704 [Daphnia magna]
MTVATTINQSEGKKRITTTLSGAYYSYCFQNLNTRLSYNRGSMYFFY